MNLSEQSVLDGFGISPPPTGGKGLDRSSAAKTDGSERRALLWPPGIDTAVHGLLLGPKEIQTHTTSVILGHPAASGDPGDLLRGEEPRSM